MMNKTKIDTLKLTGLAIIAGIVAVVGGVVGTLMLLNWFPAIIAALLAFTGSTAVGAWAVSLELGSTIVTERDFAAEQAVREAHAAELARAKRSAAAKKGWKTRRAKAAAKKATAEGAHLKAI